MANNMTTLQILQGIHDWVLDKIDEETANFITKTVNDLVNYYTKSETYTKVEVQQIVDAIKQFTYEVVQVLPTASASTMNKIYLVPAPESEDKNIKEEYITILSNGTYSWEMLGTTSIDLSNYYTKGQTDSAITAALNSALANYTTTEALTALLAAKQDVIQDLATIRSGASAGATAVQPDTLSSALNNTVSESGVFDLSVHNAVDGVPATYASLSAALTALDALSAGYKTGGMSFKFIHSSDNKYVQYRLMADEWSTTESDWQGVDEQPTTGSENLVKSGGVVDSLIPIMDKIDSLNTDVNGLIYSGTKTTGAGQTVILKENISLNTKNIYTLSCNTSGDYLVYVYIYNNNDDIITSINVPVGETHRQQDFVVEDDIDGACMKLTNAQDGADVLLTQKSIEDKLEFLGERIEEEERRIITKERTDFWQLIKSVNLFNKNSNDLISGICVGNRITQLSGYIVTHPIELSAGVTYKMPEYSSELGQNAIKCSMVNTDKTIIASLTCTKSGNFNLFTPSTSGLYIFNIGKSQNLSSFMLCKEDEYPQDYVEYVEDWILPDLNYKFLSIDEEILQIDTRVTSLENKHSVLWGKSVVFDGDSICAGNEALDGNRVGWAKRIGDANNMIWSNVAEGGGTVTSDTYFSDSRPRHWISRYIDTIISTHSTLDYLILNGGTNDADLLSDSRIGTFNATDFTGPFDDTTLFGALDTLFFKAINAYPSIKIGFICGPKMGRYPASSVNRRLEFFQKIIQSCNKWGVHVLDLWTDSILNPNLLCHYNPSLSVQENISQGYAYMDGQHPTAVGYNIITPIIENWMILM